jgi:hypothetical protein
LGLSQGNDFLNPFLDLVQGAAMRYLTKEKSRKHEKRKHEKDKKREQSGPGGPRPIKVPAGGWNSDQQQPRLPTMTGVKDHVIYTRQIDIPNAAPGQVVKVLFGGCNYGAEVFINERKVTEHHAPMTPFEADLQADPGLTVRVAASAADAVGRADIICTATTSATPVFADRDLPPGVHINAIGSYQPQVQEIPVETVIRARVVVDQRQSALAETGDLMIPIQQGLFSADRIHAEIGEIVAGFKSGRQSVEEVTLFKSVGLAVQDAAAAVKVLRKTEELGLGTLVELD